MTIGDLASTLVGINLLAWAMVKLRPKLYGTKLFKPMLTNIKLSVLPMVVLMGIFALVVGTQALASVTGLALFEWLGIAVAVLGLVVWVLLLPNAGYLITELNFTHRNIDKVEVPLWYDIVAVLSLAMSGVMNMCFNVFFLHFILALLLGGLAVQYTFLLGALSWVPVVLLLVLASFGIYLGRYIRFNSWDVKHPAQFIKKLRAHFQPAGSVKNCALFTLFHSLFFIVFYHATMGTVLQSLLPAFLT